MFESRIMSTQFAVVLPLTFPLKKLSLHCVLFIDKCTYKAGRISQFYERLLKCFDFVKTKPIR